VARGLAEWTSLKPLSVDSGRKTVDGMDDGGRAARGHTMVLQVALDLT